MNLPFCGRRSFCVLQKRCVKQKPKAVSLRAAVRRRGNLKGKLDLFMVPKDIEDLK